MSNSLCPRCGASFHCGVDDAGPCPCTTLQLAGPTLQSLRERYTGCLCMNCLTRAAALDAEAAASGRAMSP
ncbi:MAG: cysteine-rich CWC family protein [Burkholderiaceae bacterium]